jgi:hypothetical protein
LGSSAAVAGPLFVDASEHLPNKPGIGQSMNAKAGDIDGDGDSDLVIAMERQANRLLMNDGRGRFKDASERVRVRVKANAVVTLGANDDGKADLFFGGDKVSVLLLGDGRGASRDGSVEWLPATYGATQHAAVGDVNGPISCSRTKIAISCTWVPKAQHFN